MVVQVVNEFTVTTFCYREVPCKAMNIFFVGPNVAKIRFGAILISCPIVVIIVIC